MVKDIEKIRCELSILKPHANIGHYKYEVGRFTIHIYLYDIQDVVPSSCGDILSHETVDILLTELRGEYFHSLSLRDDPLFSSYEPIQYNVITTPNGKINLSDGNKMPIHHLCELIYYLYRLSNLTVFM